MTFIPISTVLKTLGLRSLNLDVLYPDASLYDLALFQPQCRIAVTDNSVKNSDLGEKKKHIDFFKLCVEKNISLAITPEYSTPWEALNSLLDDGIFPSNGKLWVIGMESITRDEIDNFRRTRSDNFKIYFEERNGVNGNFLDPVCYLFQAEDANNNLFRVILIQFKTQAMGGTDFEKNNLIKGQNIYILNNSSPQSISLATLICADTLAMNTSGTIDPIGAKTLIIHIQLTPEPKNPRYATYRNLIFEAASESEIICLNWAQNLILAGKKHVNPAGSGFYFQSNDVNLSDERVNQNHIKGLYFTFLSRQRVTAYYLNYNEHIFLVRCTKPYQYHAAFGQRSKSGPIAQNTYSFNRDGSIIENISTQDDFLKCVENHEGNLTFLSNLHATPIQIERLLELSLGKIQGTDWQDLKKISYFKIDSDETIKRISYAQDTHQDTVANRTLAIRNFAVLASILESPLVDFPIQIKSLKTDSYLGLKKKAPHSNLIATDNSEFASVVYLGEVPTISEVKLAHSKLVEVLGENIGSKRGIIWYRNFNGTFSFFPETSNESDYDYNPDEDPTSFVRGK